jgi:hypothetical protein
MKDTVTALRMAANAHAQSGHQATADMLVEAANLIERKSAEIALLREALEKAEHGKTKP